jgi:hypothetical protein
MKGVGAGQSDGEKKINLVSMDLPSFIKNL